MSTQDKNDEAPSLMKPSAMKGRGLALPGLGGALPPGGFKPPIGGLKSPPIGGGVPAGLAEALAKRRQQKSKSEEEENNNNNNDNLNGEGEGKELKNGLRNTTEGADTSEAKTENDAKPTPPPKLNFTPPSKLTRPELNSSSTLSSSSAEKNKLAAKRSEENDLRPDSSPVEKRSSASKTKGKRISSIQAGLNFNPLMLRPPSAGNSPSKKSGPAAPAPATPATPFSPPPVDLNAPPPLQHARSLLTNDAIKSRPKMSAQRKPQTRRARKANSESEATAITKQVAEKTKSSPLPDGIDSLARNSDSTSSIEEEKSRATRKSVEKLTEEKDDKASVLSQSGKIKNEEKCAGGPDAEEDVGEEVFFKDAIGGAEKDVKRKEETEGSDLSDSKDDKLCISSRKEGATTTEVTGPNEDAKTDDATSKPEHINIVVTDDQTAEERVIKTAKYFEQANDSPSPPSSSASSPPSSPLPPPLPTSSPPPLD